MHKIAFSFITEALGFILIAGVWCAVILALFDCL
jgi:hypothetical protein